MGNIVEMGRPLYGRHNRPSNSLSLVEKEAGLIVGRSRGRALVSRGDLALEENGWIVGEGKDARRAWESLRTGKEIQISHEQTPPGRGCLNNGCNLPYQNLVGHGLYSIWQKKKADKRTS